MRISMYLALALLIAAAPQLATAASARLSNSATETGITVPRNLPPVSKGPMTVSHSNFAATSTLSFDDGTCEAGMGVGATGGASSLGFLVHFDVPTVCTQSGLDVIGLSARINTIVTGGTASFFVLHQDTATVPNATPDVSLAIAGLSAQGACTGAAAGFQTRSIGPSAAVVNNTVAFFAGIGGDGMFGGRDTNSGPAGRMWATCTLCGGSVYSPAALSGLGLGGNWNIRVTVEDANCVPVELMGFDIE